MLPKSHRVAGKNIKLGNDLVRSGQKLKYQKQHDIPEDVVSSGKKKNQDTPEEPEEHNFNNVREKLHAHKVVQYIEDSSSQHDNTADDSDYYPSSQAS